MQNDGSEPRTNAHESTEGVPLSTCQFCGTVATPNDEPNCSSLAEAYARTPSRPYGCPWFDKEARKAHPKPKGEPVGVAVEVPKEQRIKYKVTPMPGGIMSASSIGGQLRALARLLEWEAKDDEPKGKLGTFILGAYTHEDGTIEFDLMVAPKTLGNPSQEPT